MNPILGRYSGQYGIIGIGSGGGYAFAGRSEAGGRGSVDFH
jgi:hypothetical protein